MKKRNLILCVLIPWLMEARAQKVSVMTPNLEPTRSDTSGHTNEFHLLASVSYKVPHKETTDFQSKRLGDVDPRGHFDKIEMEMFGFLPLKFDKQFELHLFWHGEGHPMHHVSVRSGIGVLSRELHSSFGVFKGSYYRWVPDDGNFVTRRGRQFDNYPLHGWYLQTSLPKMSFYFAVVEEKRDLEYELRAAGRLGRIVRFLEKDSRLQTLEVVVSREEFTGFGSGLSLEISPQTRMEVLWVTPERYVRNDRARLGDKLTSGVLVSLSCTVN